MNRWQTFGLLLTTLLVGVLVAGLMPAMSQGGGQRFVLCEKNGKQDFEQDIDTDGDGQFSVGDMFVFSEPTFDSNGKRIGKTAGSGTVIRTYGERDALVAITVNAQIDGGELEIQGAVKGSNFRKSPAFAIVGGTGRFAGAGGSLTVDEGVGCGGFGRGDKITVDLN
ncbi:MAG TPA: hypothetical protein VE174_00095 [Actinomycetota bacterium]|nr:hypothetical protein [Actinomycetota bacterium]